MDHEATQYRIRLARLEELLRLRELEYRTSTMFSGLGLIEAAPDVSFSSEDLISLVELRQVWVACDTHDVPVGMVVASVRDGAGYIEELDISPAHGGRGFGSLLLDQVCAWAEAQGRPRSDSLHVPTPSLKRAVLHQEWLPDSAAKRVDGGHTSNPQKETQHGLRVEARVFMRRELERHPIG